MAEHTEHHVVPKKIYFAVFFALIILTWVTTGGSTLDLGRWNIFVALAIGFNWRWGLMFSHVVGGGLWTGIDLFVGLVIGPILGRLSIPARAEFSARFMPKMVIIMPTVVMMTLATGFQIARQLGNLKIDSPNHAWLIVSFCVVGVMAAVALGDRLESIITLNEPWVSSFIGYTTGHHAPGKQDLGDGVIAAHHLLLGHGLAVESLRSTTNSCDLGITVNLSVAVPASTSELDVKVASRHDDQLDRWFLDPILKGSYPESLLEEYVGIVGDDFIHADDMATISADIDFLGVNYYTRNILAARDEAHEPWTRKTTLSEFGDFNDVTPHETPRTTKDWPIDPDGLHDLLVWITESYGKIPLYVTENGAAFIDYVDQSGAVHDSQRVDYLRDHFAAAHRALASGVDLRGYFVWSLFDNFEWADGYSQRFGLVFIDYHTQERILKDSARWYKSVISANGVDLA